ncbi:MAG: helix-turn-helix domain-containing protein [Synergistaceae bacterium]|nr:helix-turn-helix domain-containing protein [Synergistaceae bacterium]
MEQNNFSGKQTDAANDLSVLGAHLKSLREAQGLSLDDVERSTHVRPHILRAIEEGRVESEAPMVYARGFIKTYCEFLMAMDLWRKYGGSISPEGDASSVGGKPIAGNIDLKHPTPIFRRSSIIWVYMVLVVAVLCAAYLLWNQHGALEIEGFFLRGLREMSGSSPDIAEPSISSGDRDGAAVPPAIPSAEEFGIFSYDISTSSASLAGGLPSSDRASSRSGDLSWMVGGGGGPPSVDSVVPQAPQAESVRARDRRLSIVITGGENNLIVEQNGKVVTRRRLAKGGTREYDVKGDTSVSLSVGNRAEITWFGKKYGPVGLDASPLSLVFRPDGSVSVKSGATAYFRRENGSAGANGN